MKPLTLEETRLKEEMKNNCLKVGQYKDEKAKDKFKMLCHLEDFEVQYWELQQENKQLKIQISAREEVANKYKEVIDEARECIKNNYHLNWYVESNYKDELLQILDKGESNE